MNWVLGVISSEQQQKNLWLNRFCSCQGKEWFQVHLASRIYLSHGQGPGSFWQLQRAHGAWLRCFEPEHCQFLIPVWESQSPTLLCFSFSFEQVPTPEGKQHTGGQRGQSSVWTQPVPTDQACQSLDLACLECWEELSHYSTWPWHHIKLLSRDCHGEGGEYLLQILTFRSRNQIPTVKGRKCGKTELQDEALAWYSYL